MLATSQLIAAAEATGASLRETSQALGLNPNALARAKHDGRLSPGVAAALASHLGEAPGRWAVAAAAESERSPALRRTLSTLASTLST